MGGKHTGANYDLAKAEADKVDAQIIETLKTGHSFRVEAGAGSGKTYPYCNLRQNENLLLAACSQLWGMLFG